MIVRTPGDVGSLIRERRMELGLDQQELARRAGVSRLWVNEMEKGKRRAEVGLVLRTLLALDLALDVSPEPTPGSAEGRRGALLLADINTVLRRARKQR